MRLLSLLLLFLAIGAAAAVPASAQTDCVAPPGNAAIEQYCESVPAATGDKGDGATAPQPLDRQNVRELQAQGADGAALAQLLQGDGQQATGTASAPARKRDARVKDKPSSRGGVADSVANSDEPASNPLSAVSSAVEAGPTLGGPFGWAILALSTLLFAATWIRTRSRRG